jgi:type II secretory pathway component GspD/PulD (secretin)
MRTRLLTYTLSAVTVVLSGYAQNNEEVSANPSDEISDSVVQIVDAEPPLVVIDEGVTASSMERGRDTLSVDFPDEEIRNILRNVADLFELNLVIPDTLQGNTSIKLRDVTWRQIFEVVLGPAGYTFVEEGNIIKVVSQNSLLQEPVTTDVFVINYARADDLRGSIEPLIDTSAGGRIVVNARSNALVITERPSRLSRIRPIIEQLDKATDQVMIESKFVEVTNRDVKNIGVNWSSLQNYAVRVGGINRSYDATNGRDGLNTTTDSRQNGNSTTNTNSNVSANDSTSSEDSTSSNSTTVSSAASPLLTSTLDSSIASGSTLSNTISNSVVGSAISDSTFGVLNDLATTNSTGRVTSAVFSADEFQLILSALKIENQTKLVSNPTIVTLNNTEAQINIGEEYPIPSYTYNAERGTFEVSGFEYRPIGIILKVTPQVNAQGFIKLTIEPEVSSRNGTTSFGGAGGAEIPIIATRKSKTQVSLKDGFTMGIGGLMRNTTTNGNTRVPVLGSIPGLGRLFRSDTKDNESLNLLIFITARTVSADGAPIEDVFDPRAVRSMGIREDELPGFRDGSDPFGPMQPNDQ